MECPRELIALGSGYDGPISHEIIGDSSGQCQPELYSNLPWLFVRARIELKNGKQHQEALSALR
jgi:hypothetical protein